MSSSILSESESWPYVYVWCVWVCVWVQGDGEIGLALCVWVWMRGWKGGEDEISSKTAGVITVYHYEPIISYTKPHKGAFYTPL